MSSFELLIAGLTLQAGYNSALVTIGAALLGIAAGGCGTFVFLRRRALVSDAVAHATLPGVGIAFMLMVAFGGDGQSLPGLLAGSALSAFVGLLAVGWLTHRTRLTEDAAIGAVLSVFFGLGIVLLTVVQSMSAGRQAGLESFLLGQTAGMLRSEAITIAAAGALCAVVVFVLRRSMTLVAFDPEYAVTTGVDVRRTDLAMMTLALVVTVIGLKVVGLILIVAMLIIPPVTARFWTNRADRMVLVAALAGGAAGWIGAAVSTAAEALPTGPIIVLVSFAIFAISLFFSPLRGVVAAALQRVAFQRRVHLRQGLLALARGEAIYDGYTIAVLRRRGLIRPDGIATFDGRAAAAKALRDEARWQEARRIYENEAVASRYDGLTPIEDVLAPDEIEEIDRRLGPPAAVESGGGR